MIDIHASRELDHCKAFFEGTRAIVEAGEHVPSSLRSAGMIPVITHPERNPVLQHKADTLSQWVQDGCLLQITAQSLLGWFGPEGEQSASSLLRKNMVHFVAGDAHDCEDRPPRVDASFHYVDFA